MSKLCVRCGRLRALPGVEWCWECAGEKEREQWWEHVKTRWFSEFAQARGKESWENLRRKKRLILDKTGYFPEGRWLILCTPDEITSGEVRPGAKLSFSHIKGITFETNLSNVEMQGCFIENTTFKGNLYGVDFSNSVIVDSGFDGVEIINDTLFVGAHLNNVNLWGTVFNNVNLSSAAFIKVNLDNSIFQKVTFAQTSLKEVGFRNVTLEPSPEPKHVLRKSNFDEKNGINDEPEYLPEIYEELMAYWSRLGYVKDAEWARVKYLNALLKRESPWKWLKSKLLKLTKKATRPPNPFGGPIGLNS